ncbi:phosphohistidine phosphatase SixA [Thermodesulfobacteriota bacterium]
MSLLLVQHGKNLPKDKDPEKGLSPEGKKNVEQVAGTLRSNNVSVSSIWHSGLKRARQTADIFAASLGSGIEVLEKEGLAPLDDVTKLNPDPDENIMLVGHLPFMERLVSFLLTDSPDRPPVVKFKNGGVVAIDRDIKTGSWFIKWTLFPHFNQ